MSESGIPQELQAFIARHIDSVVQLEALLLLYDKPDRSWTADEAAKELRIDPGWAANQLAQLCTRQLLECRDTTTPTYRYRPATPELGVMATDLAKAYADRRVSVITLIYSKPPTPAAATTPADPLKSFADAFRLRKDNGNG